jgi:hypothetical protein
LETIALKCLEKEPRRRYASAKELAEELHRFLSGEPIVARPISRTERVWRWCKRKPLAAGLVGVTLLLVGLLSIGGPLWAVREARLKRTANEQKEEAQNQRHKAEWRLYANHIAFAQREWETNNVFSAWEHLDACRKDLRGWEHDYLYTLFNKNQ